MRGRRRVLVSSVIGLAICGSIFWSVSPRKRLARRRLREDLRRDFPPGFHHFPPGFSQFPPQANAHNESSSQDSAISVVEDPEEVRRLIQGLADRALQGDFAGKRGAARWSEFTTQSVFLSAAARDDDDENAIMEGLAASRPLPFPPRGAYRESETAGETETAELDIETNSPDLKGPWDWTSYVQKEPEDRQTNLQLAYLMNEKAKPPIGHADWLPRIRDALQGMKKERALEKATGKSREWETSKKRGETAKEMARRKEGVIRWLNQNEKDLERKYDNSLAVFDGAMDLADQDGLPRMHGVLGVSQDGRRLWKPRSPPPPAHSAPGGLEANLKKGGFYLPLSDALPLDRPVLDSREPVCQDVEYDILSLPDASIVITFYNEALSTLLRTVHSVLNYTPAPLLHEIILVDDHSNDPDLMPGSKLDQYLPFLPKTKILRLSERKGLVHARLAGARMASGDVLVVLDSHVEMNPGWLEPQLQRIKEDPAVVVFPQILSIDPIDFTFNEFSGIGCEVNFKWGMQEQSSLSGRVDRPDAIPSPSMAGGLFAVRLDFFWHIGGYDEGFSMWGAENVEMGFRVWMCGGRLECTPCARTYHIYRMKGLGYTSKKDSLLINKLRAARGWTDEYFKIARLFVSPKLIDYGSMDNVLELRDRLQCRSFDWYLNTVAKSKKIKSIADLGRHGELRFNGTRKCLDTMSHNDAGKTFGSFSCHGEGGTQNWIHILRTKQIVPSVAERLCLSTTLKFEECRPGRAQWEAVPVSSDDKEVQLKELKTNKCLQIIHIERQRMRSNSSGSPPNVRRKKNGKKNNKRTSSGSASSGSSPTGSPPNASGSPPGDVRPGNTPEGEASNFVTSVNTQPTPPPMNTSTSPPQETAQTASPRGKFAPKGKAPSRSASAKSPPGTTQSPTGTPPGLQGKEVESSVKQTESIEPATAGQETETASKPQRQDTQTRRQDTQTRRQDTDVRRQDTETRRQDTETRRQDSGTPSRVAASPPSKFAKAPSPGKTPIPGKIPTQGKAARAGLPAAEGRTGMQMKAGLGKATGKGGSPTRAGSPPGTGSPKAAGSSPGAGSPTRGASPKGITGKMAVASASVSATPDRVTSSQSKDLGRETEQETAKETAKDTKQETSRKQETAPGEDDLPPYVEGGEWSPPAMPTAEEVAAVREARLNFLRNPPAETTQPRQRMRNARAFVRRQVDRAYQQGRRLILSKDSPFASLGYQNVANTRTDLADMPCDLAGRGLDINQRWFGSQPSLTRRMLSSQCPHCLSVVGSRRVSTEDDILLADVLWGDGDVDEGLCPHIEGKGDGGGGGKWLETELVACGHGVEEGLQKTVQKMGDFSQRSRELGKRVAKYLWGHRLVGKVKCKHQAVCLPLNDDENPYLACGLTYPADGLPCPDCASDICFCAGSPSRATQTPRMCTCGCH